MHSYPRWKIWLILAVLVISAMGSLPNIAKAPSWWPSAMSKPMSLGLDLKGGIHLVLDVDVDKAITHTVEEDLGTVRQELRKARIRYSKLEADGRSQTVELKDAADMAAAEKLLHDNLNGYTIAKTAATTFTLTLDDKDAQEIRKFAVDQAIEVIRGRIDALGTTEPVIVKQGDRRILVQIGDQVEQVRAVILLKEGYRPAPRA